MFLFNRLPLLSNLTLWLESNSSLLTILVLIAIELLDNTPLEILNPTPVYLAAVVYAAASGGMRTGLVSTLMVVLYAMTSFSTPGRLFNYTIDDGRRILVIALGTLVIALMVGNLKERLDRSIRRQQAADVEIRQLQAELERSQSK